VLGYGTEEGGKMRSYDGSNATGEHTQSDYIADGQGGQPGVSKIDANELQNVATAIGLPYYHRTGGSGDDPTSKFTNLDIEAVTSDGRTKTNARVYLTWPLGIIAFGLLLWEIIDLMRTDRRLRLLMGRGR
jgi:von willebrand factor type A